MENRLSNVEKKLEDFEERFDGKLEKVHDRITKHSNRAEFHQKENNSKQTFIISEISKLKDSDNRQIEILTALKTQADLRHDQEKRNQEKMEKRLKSLTDLLKWAFGIIGTIILTASGNAIVDMFEDAQTNQEIKSIEQSTQEPPTHEEKTIEEKTTEEQLNKQQQLYQNNYKGGD